MIAASFPTPRPPDSVVAQGQRLTDCISRAVQALGTVKPAERNPCAAEVADVDWGDIQSTLAGDGAAFARLIRRYQEPITAQMWRVCRQRADCEQLVHDVFVEAYVSLRRYRGEAPLLHWLRKIATRVGYRYWKEQARRRRRASVPLEDWHRVTPVDTSRDDAEAAAALVHKLLEQLGPRDRLVLTLMYLEGCSVAETARRSGWSETMVKVQAFRARKKLRKLLDSGNHDQVPHD